MPINAAVQDARDALMLDAAQGVETRLEGISARARAVVRLCAVDSGAMACLLPHSHERLQGSPARVGEPGFDSETMERAAQGQEGANRNHHRPLQSTMPPVALAVTVGPFFIAVARP